MNFNGGQGSQNQGRAGFHPSSYRPRPHLRPVNSYRPHLDFVNWLSPSSYRPHLHSANSYRSHLRSVNRHGDLSYRHHPQYIASQSSKVKFESKSPSPSEKKVKLGDSPSLDLHDIPLAKKIKFEDSLGSGVSSFEDFELDSVPVPRAYPSRIREDGWYPGYGMDRDARSRRYDDGEVTRYGAGESYRPFNSNRSPRRARSPPRGRSPPIVDSDRYIPGRSPRRRSRSADRYRRDPSRDRRDVRDARDMGGDSWRRRDRSRSLRRSPPRRSSPRRSPPRRTSPSRRFSPRRDDRDRMRSPRRDFGSRRRSRSPYERDRGRDRSPRRSPPPIQRASTYRARSRSADRRDDRFGSYSRRPSLPRDSAISSAIPSRDTSRRSSPHPLPPRRDDRSYPESPLPSRPLSRSSHGVPTRDRTPQGTPKEQQAPLRSPPRGPAALRGPPTGPRDNRTFGSQSGGVIGPPPRPSSIVPSASGRPDISPGGPPSGPRGYVPSRGGGYGRGGRGGPGWGSTIQSRNLPPVTGPASASATAGSNSIPTGPRAGSISQSVPSTPVNQSRPFNPPKGPAAESNRPGLAQQLLSTVPSIVPGGKMDTEHLAMTLGVLPELVPHTLALKEEEEKLRSAKYDCEEKLRKNLSMWDKFEREAKILDLRLQLSEDMVKKFSGEGTGGAF
ncbi:hypothetical protein F4781DRAFT_302162 [Annulohypoxylon bovei var. microspora]|nr:hypothetical protein F4781DRAFT_302162 [Annulohypoxylon bovei var. microspora]